MMRYVKYSGSVRAVLFAAVVLAALVPQAVRAQHYVGVRAGYGMGTIARIQPAEQTGMVWGLGSGGVSYKYYGARDRFANGVQVDLQFIQKGYKRQNIYYAGAPQDTTAVFTRRINSVELPIFWHPYYTFLKGRLGVFLNLGVNISYNISSTYEWSGHRTETVEQDGKLTQIAVPVVYEKGKYDMISTRDNRWNYGLVGGFGINYIRGRSEFYFEGRYYVGYSDILKNKDRYEDNPRQSPLDGLNLSVGYFYRLKSRRERMAPYREPIPPLTPAAGELTPEQIGHESIHRPMDPEIGAVTGVDATEAAEEGTDEAIPEKTADGVAE